MDLDGDNLKRYFDVMVVVPLEEEFDIVLNNFDVREQLSSERHIRFAARPHNSSTEVILVKQSKMGRAACQDAASESLNEFDCGVAVCVGIAGAISPDLNIGDVCYTGSIVDVSENGKITDTKTSKRKLALSFEHYDTPQELVVPI
jgi:purine-nucleoside phosphorylase